MGTASDYIGREFADHLDVAKATQQIIEPAFVELVFASTTALKAGHKLLFFGNGGSAADAQHIATELVVRFQKDRPALAALALTTDSSTLTAIGNDFGFEQVFARQVEACGQAGDVAIGISTSGNSPNVLAGLARAKAMGCVAAGFTGGSGGRMREVASPLLIVPSATTARIQEMHILIGHALCGALERSLGFVKD